MSEINDMIADFGEVFWMAGPGDKPIPLVRTEVARAATARAERAEAAIQRLEGDVEELRSQRDFAMRELRAKTEAYDALGTEANTRLVRAVTAEATVHRVWELAELYKAEWQDNNGGQFFSACYDDILAALDSTDPVEAAPDGPVIGYKIGDKLYAPEDVWIVRRSDSGLPADGEERTDG